MTGYLRHFEYEITDDPAFLYRKFNVPVEVQKMFSSLYPKVKKGGPGIINKLKQLIETYPEVPHLRNYLTAAYQSSSMPEKAWEENRKLAADFPDYLFGRLNLAFEHFNKEEYEEVAALMGPHMELQELYPERNLFHIGELTAFFKLAILYFCKTNNLPAAEVRYNLMEELADGHPDLDEVRPYIIEARLRAAAERMKEEDTTRISVVPDEPLAQEGPNRRPAFTHEVINRLYEQGMRIGHDILREILALPRESLLEDLDRVLEDAILRYGHFQKICDRDGWQDDIMSFPTHALLILGELRAKESLPRLLELLRQGPDCIELWYGDFLIEELWEPTYHLVESQPDVVKTFVLSPGLDMTVRSLMTTCMGQIALHQSARKQEISDWFRDLFQSLAKATREERIVDSDFIGLAICDAMALRDPGLIPAVEVLYRKKYVSAGICGTLIEVARDMNASPDRYDKKEILNIFDHYKKILVTWQYDKEDQKQSASNALTSSFPKPGRNDPCPCGSGKKYKKCCLEH
ncbi:MAG: SEC-C metal-binding domain-containing protein [Bacteroidales bacterium]